MSQPYLRDAGGEPVCVDVGGQGDLLLKVVGDNSLLLLVGHHEDGRLLQVDLDVLGTETLDVDDHLEVAVLHLGHGRRLVQGALLDLACMRGLGSLELTTRKTGSF